MQELNKIRLSRLRDGKGARGATLLRLEFPAPCVQVLTTKKPPVKRRCWEPASLSSSTAQTHSSRCDTLCPDNGGNSGAGYSMVFRLAALRSIQLRRLGRAHTCSLLSGLPFQSLLFLFIADKFYRFTKFYQNIERMSSGSTTSEQGDCICPLIGCAFPQKGGFGMDSLSSEIGYNPRLKTWPAAKKGVKTWPN